MKAAVAKAKGRPLPPWLQKAKGGKEEDAVPAKGGKAVVVKKKFADGGSVSVPIPKLDQGSSQRATAREAKKPAVDDTPQGRNIFDVVRSRGRDLDAAEERMVKPDKKADGGKVKKPPSNAINQKGTARSDPKMSGNAKGNVLHLKNGGKVKGC